MVHDGRHNILGISIDAIDYESAVQQIINAGKAEKNFTVSALAVHGVMTGALDPEHALRLNSLDLVVPDGQPVRWALNWLHRKILPSKLKDRVYGPNLTLYTAEACAKAGLGIYLYGSKQEVLENFAQNLKKKYPTLIISGMEPSKFSQVTKEEQKNIAERIQSSGAKVVFIGLGCPRQEVWIYEHQNLLHMPTLAVGAAFDFHAGLLPQAPFWMQTMGLEWLFRLYQEPRRLWKRYLFLNPVYVWKICIQSLGWAEKKKKRLGNKPSFKGFA